MKSARNPRVIFNKAYLANCATAHRPYSSLVKLLELKIQMVAIMKINVYFIVSLLLIAMQVACGDETSSPTANNNTGSVELEGTWESTCFADGDNYKVTTIIFTAIEMDLSGRVYGDSSCNGPFAQESGASGIYSIGDEIMTTNGVTAYEIDVTVMIANNEAIYMDIVQVEGDLMYVSGEGNVTVRPQTLDFDKAFYRQ
jgi:hypothetical protein